MSDMTNIPIDKRDKYSCKGYNLDKLLQPNILILLAKQNLHGYSISYQADWKKFACGLWQ